MGTSFGAEPVLGSQATFDGVTREIGGDDIVYFDTHGVALALKGRILRWCAAPGTPGLSAQRTCGSHRRTTPP